jgi:hypothetical protein
VRSATTGLLLVNMINSVAFGARHLLRALDAGGLGKKTPELRVMPTELVMVSCVETYRLARWTSIDADTISWQEDTARIDAEIVLVTANELSLRLRLVNESVEWRYRLAEVPYVCPDLRP